MASLAPTVAFLAALSVTQVGRAQSTHVVPSGFGYESSGGGVASAPIASAAGIRTMQVIDASAMGFATGRITAIELRHSAFWTQSYASTQNSRVALGYTNRDTTQVPTQFAQFPSQPMTDVFLGRLSLPDSRTTEIPRSWSVRIPLQNPWIYDASQGHFLFEFETRRIDGDLRFWSGDVHVRSPGGAGFQRTVQGCDGLHAQLSTPGEQLTPGHTLRFRLERAGIRSLSGAAMLGLPTAGYPLELSSVGAPGCWLATSPLAFQPAQINAHLQLAVGFVDWRIPVAPGILGFEFDHQAYMLQPSANSLGAIASTGHRIQVGSPTMVLPQATQSLTGTAGATVGTVPASPTGWILRLTNQ